MNIKEVGCLAKMSGTMVTLGGAFLMALYKGPILRIAGSSATHVDQPENVNDPSGHHWLLGACFLLIGCAGFAAFYILQVSLFTYLHHIHFISILDLTYQELKLMHDFEYYFAGHNIEKVPSRDVPSDMDLLFGCTSKRCSHHFHGAQYPSCLVSSLGF